MRKHTPKTNPLLNDHSCGRIARSLLLCGALLGGGAATAQTVGYFASSGTPYGNVANNAGLNIGQTFTVAHTNIQITSLGVYDYGGDGLKAPHTVTLFSNQTALVSITVPAGAAAVSLNNFCFATLPTPVTLVPGTYSVVAYQMNGTANNSDGYGDVGSPARNGFNGSFNVQHGQTIFEFTSNQSAYPGTGGNSLGTASANLASASFQYTEPSATTTIGYTADPAGAQYGQAADKSPGLNIGHTFVVSGTGIDIDQLGVFDWHSDGLKAEHTVTLFRNDGGGYMPVDGGSVTVPAGTVAPLGNGFRFAPLTAPVSLTAGSYAIIVFQLNGNTANNDPYGEANVSGFNASGNVMDAGYSPYLFTSSGSPEFPTGGANANFAVCSFTYRDHATTTNPEPSIISQVPALYTNKLVLFAGASPTFSVKVAGSPTFTYKWFTNGVVNSAATGDSLLWSNLQTGSYSAYCIVTNSYGAVTSAVWSASVSAAPTSPYPQAVLADKPIGYWRLNEADNGQQNYNAGVLARDYMGGNDGIYTNTDLGLPGYSATTDPATTSAVFGYESMTDGLAYGIGGINFASAAGTSKAFSIEAWVNAYTPISDSGIVAKGYGDGGEQFSLDTGGTGYGFRFMVRNAAGSASVASSSIVPVHGVWHHLVGVCDQPNGQVLLYVDGLLAASANLATGSGIIAGSTPVSIGARFSSAGAMAANSYDRQYAGSVNDVAIYNTALSSNQVQTHFFSSGTAPVITQQPVASTNVFQNGPLTISVGVNGTQPMTYSWFDVNADSYIAGQTNATLNLSSVPNNNSYYLTAVNAYGTTNSSTVTVAVITGLNATLTPNANLALYAGRSVTYTANAQGTYPFYYHWYTNGVAITTATNSTFTLPVTVGSNSLSCVVNNSSGNLTLGPVGLVGVTAPTNLYQVTVISNNPVAYWPLNEADNGLNNGNAGVVACDYIGGHNGTYANAYLGLTGFNTNSYAGLTAPLFGVFATNNSLFVETDNSANGLANINFAQPAGKNAAFSVEAWVRLTNSVQEACIVAKGNGHSEQFVLDVYNSRFRFFMREAAGTAHDTGTSGTATVGQWYHVVGVWDGPNGLARLYVNGANVANGSYGTGLGLLAPAVNASLPGASLINIGSRSVNTSATSYDVQFPGQIADVAIYNYVLGASQIVADYASGTNQPAVVAPGVLSPVRLANGQMQLVWNFGGTLQSATNVAGPYTTETGATSPFTITTTNAQMYYRVKQQ